MKKILVLVVIALLSISVANADKATTLPMVPSDYDKPVKTLDEANFEAQLGLTKKQKAKSQKIKMNCDKKLKPILKKIEAKKQEAEMVKRSKIAIRDQEVRLAVLNKEIENLEQQANKIKELNKKKFELTLTRKQKKILKQMENLKPVN